MVAQKSRKPLLFDPAKDVTDLAGKVFVVTGGNSGLGYETVKQLYAHNAKVYLACRDEKKGKDAIARMKQELQGMSGDTAKAESKVGEVLWLQLDLSDPRKARKAGEEFLKIEQRLDVLVNNAGITSGIYSVGPDTLNIQRTMMVNHLSPFIFTLMVLPLLKQTASEPNSDVRIVILSSSAVKNPTFKPGRLHFRDKEDFNDRHKDDLVPIRGRYASSKVANALFSVALTSRLEKEKVPILVAAVDPGFVYTGKSYHVVSVIKSSGIPTLVVILEGIREQTVPALHKGLRTLYKMFSAATYTSPSKGVAAQLYASTSSQLRSEAAAQHSKLLWIAPSARIGRCPNEAMCTDEALAEELWAGSLKVLEEVGAKCDDLSA
ncbi:hypothetical protein EIP91_010207 [Steccherinum ochraceum]|uniref:NAD(P)-binding protein n=1 Tax=Steccherinum ochraceum TaxID=92696 RepID=A0A4R0RPT7_9APHY|nr:hypothetical protein EIP91_000226 [Steccherinum ochraceum]TCD68685.1 hypothetical protein EIP91_010207 [Steccherinum ochraceum]